ncbi:MAG: DMT family transporter [Alphaproteobacteria bacterium]|nr:DMT family transporter [Alphaproteobacteria bacterium]
MTPRMTGILLMMASMVVFTLLDASAKYVMHSLPPPVAVFFRYFVAALLSAGVVMKAGGPSLLVTRYPFLQVVRGLLLMVSTVFNFIAMSHLQLAQTAAIFFTIPLWVCALSVPLLGEQVGYRRWIAVTIGFLGVLVIMRPGTGSFHWAMLFSIAASICGATYNIVTRKVSGGDRAETSLFYVSVIGATAASFPLPWTWQLPQGIAWPLLIFMGLAGGIGHYMLIQAHRLAPASVLAPFVYTQIVWMIIVGFLVFRDVPDLWTLVGAFIVVSSGLFVFARERKLGRETSVPAPGD